MLPFVLCVARVPQSSLRDTVNMFPKHKMLIKNTRLICIFTPRFGTPWQKKKKISFPLWFCWLQSDALLKLIRTLWSDVMRGWPHATPPPVPLPPPPWLQSPKAYSSLLPQTGPFHPDWRSHPAAIYFFCLSLSQSSSLPHVLRSQAKWLLHSWDPEGHTTSIT